MAPKRNIKTNKVKPPQLSTLNSLTSTDEQIEAELKFDNEVLWCIKQFEKLINSGKLNDAKKHESIKAIATLRRKNVSKIEKIQLMKSYFKDYKTKMSKDEEEVKTATKINIECLDECKPSGKFLKKKLDNAETKNLTDHNSFFFNFNSSDQNLSEAVNKIELSN